MKLIHIENKIDPNDVVQVIREAKLDFAREINGIVKSLSKNGKFVSGDEVIGFMCDILRIDRFVL